MAWSSEWSHWDTDTTESALAIYEIDPMRKIFAMSLTAKSNESEGDGQDGLSRRESHRRVRPGLGQ
jgi:hypothetical protein